MVAVVIGTVLLAILGYLAQIAIFPAFGAVFIGPNMIISLSIVFGLMYGAWPAMAMGFFGGLMVDFMAGGTIGVSSLVPMAVGFLLADFKREINSGHILWAVIFAAISHLINDFWNIIILYFGRIDFSITFGTLFRSLVSAVETGIFAGIYYLLITKLLMIGEKRSGLPYLQRY